MSHAEIIHRIASRQPARPVMRACKGPLCLGVSLPRGEFHSDRAKHCRACVDYLQVQKLKEMLEQAKATADRSFSRRQRTAARMRDLDQIAKRSAGESEE
jgi:hypothetical protein